MFLIYFRLSATQKKLCFSKSQFKINSVKYIFTICDSYSNVASAFESEIHRSQNIGKLELNSRSFNYQYDATVSTYLNLRDIGRDIVESKGQLVTEENISHALFHSWFAIVIENNFPADFSCLIFPLACRLPKTFVEPWAIKSWRLNSRNPKKRSQKQNGKRVSV